jgi:esterase
VSSGVASWPLPPGVKSVEANGYLMAYLEKGSGVPLVLVHGTLCDYRFWFYQIEQLAEYHRVTALSLRHYFPEPWDGRGGNFSIAQHASDLEAFITTLGLGAVHLLGHSRGGAVVLEVAKRHPQMIRSLILADPAVRLDLAETHENRKATAFRAVLFSNLLEKVAKGEVEAGTAQFIDGLLGSGAWGRLPSQVHQVFLQNVRTALVNDPLPLTIDEELRRFDFPILTITGEHSPPFYRLIFAEMQKRANFPQPIVIPDASHAMNFANPAAFNAAVMQFTTSH